MYRYIFLTLLFISVFSSVCAQKTTHAVYLENGSIIRGDIIRQDSSGVALEACCGSIFVFSSAEILRIGEEPAHSEHQWKSSGYINHTSMGVLLGSSANEREAPFSVLTEHAYLINSYVSAGLMLGYELLEEPVFPLAFSVKAYLPMQRTLLVGGIATGYSFSIENPDSEFFESNKGGLLFNGEIGFMIPVSDNNSFLIAVGYRYNVLNYTREDFWLGEVERKVSYNRLNLRLGLSIY